MGNTTVKVPKKNGALLTNDTANRPQTEKKVDKNAWRKTRRPKVTSCTIDTRAIKISRGCVRPHVTPGSHWEDPCFPREMAMEGSSIEGKQYRWMTPKEFCENPVLVKGVPSRHDVIQGNLGNCWMMATLAGIADNYPAIRQIIGSSYNPATRRYDGVFHCRLWHYGQWVDVYVDDYLPVRYDPSAPKKYRLIGARSPDPDVLWVALVEKALAKFHGSYHGIEAREREYGWRLMTGGVPRILKKEELERTPSDTIFANIKDAMDNGCVITCSREIEAGRGGGRGRLHAYTITAAREHSAKGRIVRLRNPWGEETGNINWRLDTPDRWTYSADEKRADFECEPGEFWMRRGEFWREFMQFCIGCFKADYYEKEHNILNHKYTYYGEWKGDQAAGPQITDIFNNPKYQIKIKGKKTKEKKFLIDLTPRPVDMHGVCVYLYKITKRKQNSSILCEEVLMGGQRAVGLMGGCPQYQHALRPGTYMLVPSVAQKQTEKEFCMRIYSNSHIRSKAITGTCFSFKDHRENDQQLKLQHYAGSWADLFVNEKTFSSVLHKMPQYHVKASNDLELTLDLLQEYKGKQEGIGIRVYELTEDTTLPVTRDFLEKGRPNLMHHPSIMIGTQTHSTVHLEKDKHYLLLAFPWNSTTDKCYVLTLGLDKANTIHCKLMKKK